MKSLFYVLIMLIASLFITGCSEETKETVEEFIDEYDEIGVYVNNISLKASSFSDTFIKKANGEIILDTAKSIDENLALLKTNIEAKLTESTCVTSTDITDGTLTATFTFTNCTVNNTEMALSGQIVVSMTIDNRTLKTTFTLSNFSIDGTTGISGTIELTTSTLNTYTINMTLTDGDKTVKFNGTINATQTEATITGTGEYTNTLTYTIVVTNLVWVYGDCYPSSGSIAMSTSRITETLKFNENTPTTGEVVVENGRKSETKELLAYGNCPPSK